MAGIVNSALRDRRQACGLSQAELAARAGVSRQLVAAAEAGINTPAVDTALALARALGTNVEALFRGAADAPVSVLPGTLPEGARIRVGRVGERLVAAELSDHGAAGATWGSPDGRIEAGQLRVFPRARPAGLVVAGCDPALGVAEALLRDLGPRSLLAVPAPTKAALAALGEDRLHAAVVHGPPGDLPTPPGDVVRWRLARWQVGLGLAAPSSSLEGVLRGRRPLARRDPGAASQQALERAAASLGVEVPDRGPMATGHIDAARLAATLGGAGVTTEAAAAAFGLRFLPLEVHDVEIWLADRWREHPAAVELGNLLASAAFTDRVAAFGGYDLTGCGTLV